MHRNIKGVRPDGEPYHALEPGAYAWVHATLASAILDGHRVLGDRFRPEDEEDFWQEWRRLGRLVGVRDRDLPGGGGTSAAYFARVVEDELWDTETVHVVFDTLARPIPPPGPSLPPALWNVARFPPAATSS